MLFANEGGGVIDPTIHLWKKIAELETRVERNEKIIEIIKTKGLQMSEEFDFDALLEEIDTETQPTESTETTQPEVKEPEVDLENIDAVPETSEESFDELESLLDDTKSEDTVGTEPVIENAPEVQVKPETPETPKVPKIEVDEISYETVGVEFAEEYIKYWKSVNDVELRKKAALEEFKEELQQIKEEFSDAGVDIKAADYTRKTIIRRMKETEEEQKLMDAVDTMLNADKNLKDSFVPFVV